MNSDERIDRLSDRIDALTQSVELLASLHGDLEKRFDGYGARVTTVLERLTEIVATDN